MAKGRRAGLGLATALVAALGAGQAQAQVQTQAEVSLACGRFTPDVLAAPEPREAVAPARRFEQIKEWVKTQPHRALFLGDSLTERWDPEAWREHMARRGVLNAGVSGDRTEHLRWRLDHGNLAGPPPRLAIVEIGTNDLGHGRTPEVAAEGVRAVVLQLRQRLPKTRILLLGLWPRGAAETDRLRREVRKVNEMIATCGDNRWVFYADIGGVLLDYRGELSRAISPDLLHFSAAGYARLAPPLDRLIDPLLALPR